MVQNVLGDIASIGERVKKYDFIITIRKDL